MRIHTIDEDFEYQIKQVFELLKENFSEQIEGYPGTFTEWLWDNCDELGKAFYERIDEWYGIDEIVEEMEQ